MLLAAAISVLLSAWSLVEGPQGADNEYHARLHFEWDKSRWEQTYLDNAEAADALADLLWRLGPERIESVTVVAYSSPEGVYEHNLKLSRERAANFMPALKSKLPDLSGRFFVRAGGEAWALLRERVEADPKIRRDAKARELRILDDKTVSDDTRKWRLAHWLEESDYRYLLYAHYRFLRCFDITVKFKEDTAQAGAPGQQAGSTQQASGKTASEIAAGEKGAAVGQAGSSKDGAAAGQNGVAAGEKAVAAGQAGSSKDGAATGQNGVAAGENGVAAGQAGSSQDSAASLKGVAEGEKGDGAGQAGSAKDVVASKDAAGIGDAATSGDAAAASKTRERRPVFALSTNLPYDITYVPNYGLTSIPSVSLEYYPSGYGRYSFGADFECPMWVHADEHRYLQMNYLTLNGRYYFSRSYQNDYHGPYLIASLGGVRFGIGFDEKGWQGEGVSLSAGLGYKRSFGRSRLFWEAGLAIGWLHALYDPYVWGDDTTHRYYYDYAGLPENFKERNHALDWFGPTRAWLAIGIDLFTRKVR